MSRPRIAAGLRRLVHKRAAGRCEYCHVPAFVGIKSLEVDHIVSIKHGGVTVAENLCLACDQCNGYKAGEIASADPLTGKAVLLFNPRRDSWHAHFRMIDGLIRGLTPIGRATVEVLRLNRTPRIIMRQELRARNRM